MMPDPVFPSGLQGMSFLIISHYHRGRSTDSVRNMLEVGDKSQGTKKIAPHWLQPILLLGAQDCVCGRQMLGFVKATHRPLNTCSASESRCTGFKIVEKIRRSEQQAETLHCPSLF